MSKEILKFSAEWCGPCKMLSNLLGGIELDIPITNIDIDQNMDKAKEYGVRGVPTLVLLDNGVEIKRLIGMQTVDAIKEFVG